MHVRISIVGSVQVKASGILGYSDGSPYEHPKHNFDFGDVNRSQVTMFYCDREFGFSDKYVHAACPYKYFADEMDDCVAKKELYDLMGYSGANDLVVVDNLCD